MYPAIGCVLRLQWSKRRQEMVSKISSGNSRVSRFDQRLVGHFKWGSALVYGMTVDGNTVPFTKKKLSISRTKTWEHRLFCFDLTPLVYKRGYSDDEWYRKYILHASLTHVIWGRLPGRRLPGRMWLPPDHILSYNSLILLSPKWSFHQLKLEKWSSESKS